MLEDREGGCHCGRVRFRARLDLDLLSQCNCTVCTKKGILHLPVTPENFELLRGKNSLTTYTFGTGVAQHTFCSHCGMHAFYIPRSQPVAVIGAIVAKGIKLSSYRQIVFTVFEVGVVTLLLVLAIMGFGPAPARAYSPAWFAIASSAGVYIRSGCP